MTKGRIQTTTVYTFQDYVDFVLPTAYQTCSYYEALQPKFDAAILEVQGLPLLLDSAPEAIEETFTEMKDNFTEYNSRGTDQLEPVILETTDEIIAKAPNMVTMSQRTNYLSVLNARLETIKDNVENDACNFDVQIETYAGKYLCVNTNDSVMAVDSTAIIENCNEL